VTSSSVCAAAVGSFPCCILSSVRDRCIRLRPATLGPSSRCTVHLPDCSLSVPLRLVAFGLEHQSALTVTPEQHLSAPGHLPLPNTQRACSGCPSKGRAQSHRSAAPGERAVEEHDQGRGGGQCAPRVPAVGRLAAQSPPRLPHNIPRAFLLVCTSHAAVLCQGCHGAEQAQRLALIKRACLVQRGWRCQRMAAARPPASSRPPPSPGPRAQKTSGAPRCRPRPRRASSSTRCPR
jgi:hypothetical protein